MYNNIHASDYLAAFTESAEPVMDHTYIQKCVTQNHITCRVMFYAHQK